MRRLTLFCIPLVLAWSEMLPAQAARDSSAAGQRPTPLCYRARPKPACSAFILTNFGGYVVTGDFPAGVVVDWGWMANVSTRDAIGTSVFASFDPSPLRFRLGPAVRYRRWLPPSGSFEVAVGAPLVGPLGSTNDDVRGAVFGLVKWSPNQWFAVAARPELVHRPVFFCGGPTNTCTSEVQWRGRAPLGVEFGWVPGLALTVAGGVALLALASLFRFE